MFTPLQRRSLCNPLLIGVTSGLWVGIPIFWGISMRSWRLTIIPVVSLVLTVAVGAIAKYNPSQEAYYLLGLLTSGCLSFVISKRLKQEAIKKFEL